MTPRDVSSGPPRVQLDHWQHKIFGERWTLLDGDRALLTFGSEVDARRYARVCGWVVEDVSCIVGDTGPESEGF